MTRKEKELRDWVYKNVVRAGLPFAVPAHTILATSRPINYVLVQYVEI